jgi:hypothetical protein
MSRKTPSSMRARAPLALALATALGITILPGLTFANTYQVTDSGDAGSGTCSTVCTLRDAISAADANPGTDTITFASTLSGDTILLDIANKGHIASSGTAALTIQGLGANQLTVSGGGVASNDNGGILAFDGGNLTISNISFADGKTLAAGGALSVVSTGDVKMSKVTLVGNYAIANGGGLSVNTTGNVRVEYSTFNGNQSYGNGSGGGFYARGTTVVVANCTLHGNFTNVFGGGFDAHGTLRMYNDTISNNAATVGGGGFSLLGGDGTMNNSIVADNTGSTSYGPEFLAGTFNYVGSNFTANFSLIKGNFKVDGTFTNSNAKLHEDPKLGPLAYNGGPTRTRALLPGSPAIDSGTNSICTPADQRQMPRPDDGNGDGAYRCDMGAFEVGPIDLDRIFANGFD